ncbi:MAG: ThuA domain-containing protein [Planctomycetes bacterium]|nr:ThuA domain-containing protein [Planctomycetota bacterium]
MGKIRTLLLSGANNHDWKRSSPFLRDVLEKSGRFAVTMTEDPSAALEDAKALRRFQLIFSDYNGPAWGEAAKANFVAAIEGGTGLVILHAADNAFTGWVEYEKMVALMWREGTGHGAYHEFEVKITDKDHPITRGLEDFRLWDELYHRLVHMHNAPYRVLATAYSAPETGGTGNDEPMMTVQQYGKGRIYHHVMGHVWPGDPAQHKGCSMMTFENAMFQKSLLRGCEWAATGQVTE